MDDYYLIDTNTLNINHKQVQEHGTHLPILTFSFLKLILSKAVTISKPGYIYKQWF